MSLTELRSHPLSPTPSHSHPFPPIFQQKQPTPSHFSTKAAHSYLFFNKTNLLPPIFKTHSYPFFKKNNPLPPIFWQKRHTPTLILIKTIDSHPFLHKNNPFPNFSIKRPTPIQGLYWIALQPLPPTPSDFYSLSDIFILLHCNFLWKQLALMRFPTNKTNFWLLIS